MKCSEKRLHEARRHRTSTQKPRQPRSGPSLIHLKRYGIPGREISTRRPLVKILWPILAIAFRLQDAASLPSPRPAPEAQVHSMTYLPHSSGTFRASCSATASLWPFSVVCLACAKRPWRQSNSEHACNPADRSDIGTEGTTADTIATPVGTRQAPSPRSHSLREWNSLSPASLSPRDSDRQVPVVEECDGPHDVSTGRHAAHVSAWPLRRAQANAPQHVVPARPG